MSQDPPALRRPVTLTNEYGWHLRPSEKFVGLAARYRSDIRIHFRDRTFNGKSILDLMGLAAECGSSLVLEAAGPDAEAALVALSDLVARFDENESTPQMPTPDATTPAPSPPTYPRGAS